MRRPRKVALIPTGIPARSLKAATDLRAFTTIGCWPVIMRTSPTADSSARALSLASPMPMLTTIFATRGTCITFS